MKQSTLQTPQVPRKTTLAVLLSGLRKSSQTAQVSSPRTLKLVFLGLLCTLGLTISAKAEPFKAADRVGRSCSAPLWSPDNRFLAYTSVDRDVVMLNEIGKDNVIKNLYSIATGEGVGRRFAFAPGEERLILRRENPGLPGKPDRLLSISFYEHDPVMLTANVGPLLGPYIIAGKVYSRDDLQSPYRSTDKQEWPVRVLADSKRLEIATASATLYRSPAEEELEGFELSPDGDWVAAVFESAGQKVLRLISTASGQTIDLGSGRWPGWSGNSRRLVFVKDKPSVEFSELVVYDLESAAARSVVGLNQYWPDEPALNSDGTRVAFVHKGEIFVTEVTGF